MLTERAGEMKFHISVGLWRDSSRDLESEERWNTEAMRQLWMAMHS